MSTNFIGMKLEKTMKFLKLWLILGIITLDYTFSPVNLPPEKRFSADT